MKSFLLIFLLSLAILFIKSVGRLVMFPISVTLCWHNKAFKTDSQRSAFSVCFGLSVYGTIL
ncbi:hypothetical protein D8T59_22605 [Vibrio vulnificus]|nr:hypothetical protein D8T59_22605 [Vibrio vulnificus]